MQAKPSQEWIRDMEHGGYAPDANNQIKRLNEVTRKWEQRLAREGPAYSSPPRDSLLPPIKKQRLPPKPPKLERQNAINSDFK